MQCAYLSTAVECLFEAVALCRNEVLFKRLARGQSHDHSEGRINHYPTCRPGLLALFLHFLTLTYTYQFANYPPQPHSPSRSSTLPTATISTPQAKHDEASMPPRPITADDQQGRVWTVRTQVHVIRAIASRDPAVINRYTLSLFVADDLGPILGFFCDFLPSQASTTLAIT